MRKLFGFLLIVIAIIAVYYDLTVGTLPTVVEEPAPPQAEATETEEEKNEEEQNEQESPRPLPDSSFNESAVEVTVEPGQTVLSIVEQLHEGPVPASIQQVSHDFSRLNNDILPEEIQIDQTYWFPTYSP
ncbi:hypothetical protein ACFPU1_11415 [Thalassorhabdus alkalitolerans]|uniref:LysM domain-containing protein n=1 Tax=Thalassorhabdus alkalitolerans TaxID=2282697 RepID=A0ABW0YRP2_9BACI|nr:hypothetical protein [Thalassobacillus sp. C254]